MKFSVVTASLNQRGWLKRCIRSVADQQAESQHIVQDAGSGAELQEWVRNYSRAELFVEKDDGIYDALNRGFRRAAGEICSWLNCDEQYLPGTFAKVGALFERKPEIDMIVGDSLVVNASGELLAFRRATPLRAAMILTDHLYDLSCAMFFRRRLFDRGIWFRPDFQAAGDAEWVCRILRSRVRVAYLRDYLATFAISGENLSVRADAALESGKLREMTPAWVRIAGPFLRHVRHLEKWWHGGYRSGPISYELYAAENDGRRTRFVCERPKWKHPWA